MAFIATTEPAMPRIPGATDPPAAPSRLVLGPRLIEDIEFVELVLLS